MELYADIIIDISYSGLDKTFQYRIPEELQEVLEPGNVVEVPFGRGDRLQKGYVLRITDHSSCPPEKMKTIHRLETDLVGADSKLTSLALWMRDHYGSTTVQALRTVLPFRQKASEKKKKRVVLIMEKQEAEQLLLLYRSKHQTARARLLEALLETPEIPREIVTGSLKVTASVLKTMEEKGIIRCEEEQIYRTPALLEQLRGQTEKRVQARDDDEHLLIFTEEQQYIIDTICREWEEEDAKRYLIHGVTGSGKTAVYMELIAEALRRGQQAILLIPEISLTYQNVIRFYQRFGDCISILHSRLSPAERYDQFERARSGDIQVMIGPRSALFTPFSNLGIIIIDEEHEDSYRSEAVPRYHAAETAWKRAKLEHARLILGSATPSLEAYYDTENGSSRRLVMKKRATGGVLPEVHTVDLREELKSGNRSILSRLLQEKMQQALDQNRQIMLFLNRRGYSGFVSCRSCGHVIKCPHCDVSLSLHRNGTMICHYCGHTIPAVKKCPSCDSPFIGGFKAGTQQIEEIVAAAFPKARILRMDADTTRGKDGHAEILRAFGNHEADILIGTQMIVKGHDFPGVTLVGILAADLSLNVSDYRAGERTFQLLTQAAGRAGRGNDAGEVVIQTYDPENHAIVCASQQDYESFYRQEIECRRMTGYPPAGGMMAVHCAGEDPEQLDVAVNYLAQFVKKIAQRRNALVIGPSDEAIAKINDIYRKALYIKHSDTKVITAMKNIVEQYIEINPGFRGIRINFERK